MRRTNEFEHSMLCGLIAYLVDLDTKIFRLPEFEKFCSGGSF